MAYFIEKLNSTKLKYCTFGESAWYNSCEGRGGEGRERSINFGINSREKSPVQNKKRSPLRFSLNSNKTEIGKGSDLRDSRWTGRGLIVELAKNGKQRVSWDKSNGGNSYFKWVIRASIEHKEKVGIGLGPRQLEAHSVYKLNPMTTSLGNSEAGECSNTYLGPFSSTSNPNGFGETTMVFPNCFGTMVVMSRSEIEGRLSVLVARGFTGRGSPDYCRWRYGFLSMECVVGRSVGMHRVYSGDGFQA